jgi:hypothetical protein
MAGGGCRGPSVLKKQAAPGGLLPMRLFYDMEPCDWWLRSEGCTIRADSQTKDIKNIFTGGSLRILGTRKSQGVVADGDSALLGVAVIG